MKHAALHVITIKFSSSDREYVTIQERLFENTDDEISICIDIKSNVSFIDESLLLQSNFWNRLKNCVSIIVKDIIDEKIIDRQLNLLIYLVVTNEAIKLLNAHAYVFKDINADVILKMNELNYEKNDIIIWLDRKKMQLNDCHILIQFSQKERMSINFHCSINYSVEYLNQNIDNVTSNKMTKQIRFAASSIFKFITKKFKSAIFKAISDRSTLRF